MTDDDADSATATVARPAPRRGQPARPPQPDRQYQPTQRYQPAEQYQATQQHQPTERYQPAEQYQPTQRYQPEQPYQPRQDWPAGREAPPAPPSWEPERDAVPGPRRPRWPVIAGIALGATLLGAGAGVYVLVAHPFSHSGTPSANAANATLLPASQSGAGQSSAAGTPTSTGTPSPTPSPTPTPSPATTERQAATALAALLSQSSSDRSAISAAYSDVSACGPSLSQDQQTFQQAATNRQNLLGKLGKLSGAQTLPATMLSDLTAAWQASEQADQDYAKWASDQSAGCTQQSYSDPAYMAAATPNQQATSNKTAFVALWNPLAQQYSLATYTQGQL